MKTYYELLGLSPTAESEEVKRAFRREIARYHPDKVQHLGVEFQEVASARSAALTEAYRILMDHQARERYNAALAHEQPARTSGDPSSSLAVPHEPPGLRVEAPGEQDTPDKQYTNAPATSEFVRRAVIEKLKSAVESLGGTSVSLPPFDAVLEIKGRRTLFRKPRPTVRVGVRVGPQVDRAAVQEAWPAAARLRVPGETTCVMLIGSTLAPARELATAVSECRRRTRVAGPVVVPVGMREWEALFPPETPPAVRLLIEQLRTGG